MRRVGFIFVGCIVAACGARTGLLAPEIGDAAPDVVEEDAAEEDAPEEDVVFPDVPIVSNCPDAGATYVYVLGSQRELYSFYPPTLAFSAIGVVDCNTTAQPNSMAVTRSGIAFANYNDGQLFAVSTANAACKATTYAPNQDGFLTFGMGYAANPDGGETLYVSGVGGTYAKGLGTIDTNAFTLGLIGSFQPPVYNCELTGTGDGRLYGFCPFATGSYLVEINPTNAAVLSSTQLSTGVGTGGYTWAFAFWGGAFWLFTGPGYAPSTVTKYDPIAKTETAVVTAPVSIVGAGVSTCAPQ